MGGAPSLIIGGEGYDDRGKLYQGGEDILDDGTWFAEHKITHLVSICHRTVGNEAAKEAGIPASQVIHIREQDMPTTDLFQHFERTTVFIHEARLKGGNVYVHCSAGISRSSTVSLAYMMAFYDIGLDELLPRLTRQRKCVCPNHGFLQQLQRWERHEKRKAMNALLLEAEQAKSILELDRKGFLSLEPTLPSDDDSSFDLDD